MDVPCCWQRAEKQRSAICLLPMQETEKGSRHPLPSAIIPCQQGVYTVATRTLTLIRRQPTNKCLRRFSTNQNECCLCYISAASS